MSNYDFESLLIHLTKVKKAFESKENSVELRYNYDNRLLGRDKRECYSADADEYIDNLLKKHRELIIKEIDEDIKQMTELKKKGI